MWNSKYSKTKPISLAWWDLQMPILCWLEVRRTQPQLGLAILSDQNMADVWKVTNQGPRQTVSSCQVRNEDPLIAVKKQNYVPATFYYTCSAPCCEETFFASLEV